MDSVVVLVDMVAEITFRYDPGVMPSASVQRQIDRLLYEAEAALTDGSWEVVRVRAEAVFALDPDNRDDRHYLEAAERGLKRAIFPSGQPSAGVG